MSKRKKEIKYEEKKAAHLKIGDVDVYAVPISERKGTKIKITELGGERETELTWGAMIVNDPQYGLMPYKAWEESWKKKIAMGLTTSTGSYVAPGTVNISGLSLIYSLKTCPKCEKAIPLDSLYCPYCATTV